MCLEKSGVAEKLQGFQKPICLAAAHIRINLASCSSLATATALLPGLCCSVWEGSSCDRTGPGGQSHLKLLLVHLGVYLRCWVGAQQLSREFYTPFTPFPRRESEKIHLQGALRTRRCKQLFFNYFSVISCGSVEPRCVGTHGVPVQLQFAKTALGATCDTTKWGLSNSSPS